MYEEESELDKQKRIRYEMGAYFNEIERKFPGEFTSDIDKIKSLLRKKGGRIE